MSVGFRRGLYAITDDRVQSADLVLSQVASALRGGATVIQYRDKSEKSYDKLALASALRQLCVKYEACFLINDDVELALSVNADGVHLGKHDHTISEARARLGDKVIGISCYNQLALAHDAAKAGANYVAFGRFFTSTIKPDAVQATPQLLSSAKQTMKIPVVAIGGITLSNADELIKAGADAVAVIDGLFGQPDIVSTARSFTRLFH